MDAAVRVRSTVTFMTRAALKRLAREAHAEGVRYAVEARALGPQRDERAFEEWWARQYPGLDDSAGPR